MEFQYLQFFTASILKWNPILFNNKYKKVILDSLRFLVDNRRIKLYAFVIMPNHVHLIWQMIESNKLKNVQRDFLRFTSQQIQKDLRTNNPALHQKFRVDLADRKYQLWQRNPKSIDLSGRKMIEQKVDYIHNNPVQKKWRLAESPLEYEYSSARFYESSENNYPFLRHYMEHFE